MSIIQKTIKRKDESYHLRFRDLEIYLGFLPNTIYLPQCAILSEPQLIRVHQIVYIRVTKNRETNQTICPSWW